MTSNTLYHYRVRSRDASANERISSDATFTTTADTVPPVISAVAASPAAQGATITWTTDEASTSQVEYGLTTAYGSTTALDSALVTSHTVSVSGLAQGTLYHFRVRSRDASGNERISSDATFTTVGDTVPPVISAVAAAPAVQGATITWTTDEASTSQVDYGLTTAYGSTTALDSAQVTSHTVTLSGLTSNTLYHYRVRSRDASGNERISSDATFITTGDTVPPVISNVAAAPAVQGATLTWTTDEASTKSGRVRADDGVWQHDGACPGAGHESHRHALRVDVEHAVSLSGAVARCHWQRADLRRLLLHHGGGRHRAACD